MLPKLMGKNQSGLPFVGPISSGGTHPQILYLCHEAFPKSIWSKSKCDIIINILWKHAKAALVTNGLQIKNIVGCVAVHYRKADNILGWLMASVDVIANCIKEQVKLLPKNLFPNFYALHLYIPRNLSDTTEVIRKIIWDENPYLNSQLWNIVYFAFEEKVDHIVFSIDKNCFNTLIITQKIINFKSFRLFGVLEHFENPNLYENSCLKVIKPTIGQKAENRSSNYKIQPRNIKSVELNYKSKKLNEILEEYLKHLLSLGISSEVAQKRAAEALKNYKIMILPENYNSSYLIKRHIYFNKYFTKNPFETLGIFDEILTQPVEKYECVILCAINFPCRFLSFNYLNVIKQEIHHFISRLPVKPAISQVSMGAGWLIISYGNQVALKILQKMMEFIMDKTHKLKLISGEEIPDFYGITIASSFFKATRNRDILESIKNENNLGDLSFWRIAKREIYGPHSEVITIITDSSSFNCLKNNLFKLKYQSKMYNTRPINNNITIKHKVASDKALQMGCILNANTLQQLNASTKQDTLSVTDVTTADQVEKLPFSQVTDNLNTNNQETHISPIKDKNNKTSFVNDSALNQAKENLYKSNDLKLSNITCLKGSMPMKSNLDITQDNKEINKNVNNILTSKQNTNTECWDNFIGVGQLNQNKVQSSFEEKAETTKNIELVDKIGSTKKFNNVDQFISSDRNLVGNIELKQGVSAFKDESKPVNSINNGSGTKENSLKRKCWDNINSVGQFNQNKVQSSFEEKAETTKNIERVDKIGSTKQINNVDQFISSDQNLVGNLELKQGVSASKDESKPVNSINNGSGTKENSLKHTYWDNFISVGQLNQNKIQRFFEEKTETTKNIEPVDKIGSIIQINNVDQFISSDRNIELKQGVNASLNKSKPVNSINNGSGTKENSLKRKCMDNFISDGQLNQNKVQSSFEEKAETTKNIERVDKIGSTIQTNNVDQFISSDQNLARNLELKQGVSTSKDKSKPGDFINNGSIAKENFLKRKCCDNFISVGQFNQNKVQSSLEEKAETTKNIERVDKIGSTKKTNNVDQFISSDPNLVRNLELKQDVSESKNESKPANSINNESSAKENSLKRKIECSKENDNVKKRRASKVTNRRCSNSKEGSNSNKKGTITERKDSQSRSCNIESSRLLQESTGNKSNEFEYICHNDEENIFSKFMNDLKKLCNLLDNKAVELQLKEKCTL